LARFYFRVWQNSSSQIPFKKELDENIYVHQAIDFRVQEASSQIFNNGYKEGAEYRKEQGQNLYCLTLKTLTKTHL
jgi:hypothetical protein